MCRDAFGQTPPDRAFDKAKIKLTWLVEQFASLEVVEGDPLWLPYLRAFFLYLIGSFIIPDATTGVVSVQYLSLMDDMGAIGDYAWGAAAWATMHGCFQRRMINGLAYALMVSIKYSFDIFSFTIFNIYLVFLTYIPFHVAICH